MNIGEMFVRVTVDPTGVVTGTRTAGVAVTRFAGTAGAATLNVNKLGNAFLSLASQATGVNPAIARLGNILGAFAIGGTVMAGVLLGITAVSVGWRLWTREAREAREEVEKLGDAMLRAADARSLGATGGQELVRAAALADKARLLAERTVLRGAVMPTGVGTEGEQGASIMAQRRLKQIEVELGQAARKFIEAGTQVGEVLAKQAEQTAALGEAARRAAEQMREATQKILDQLLRWAGEGINIGKLGVAAGEAMGGGISTFDLKTTTKAPTPGFETEGVLGTMGQVMDELGFAFTSLKASFMPLALVSEFLGGLFEELAPLMELLLSPVRALGHLLGQLLVPVVSYVAEALGWLIRALGKAINFLLPGNPANGLVKFGQGMMDQAQAMRRATGEMDALTEATREAARNVPTGFKTNLARFNATNAGTTAPSSGGGSIDPITFNGPVTIVAPDPETFARKARQLARRGGGTPLVLAYE